jgi:hypothetical protein
MRRPCSCGRGSRPGAGLLIREDPRLGSHRLGETGEAIGVEGVGLSESSRSLCEVLRLAGVDDCDGQTVSRERRGGGPLVVAAGLQDHQRGPLLEETTDEAVDSTEIVGEPAAPRGGAERHIQALLGDVYPDVAALGSIFSSNYFSFLSVGPVLADAGFADGTAALATVRAPSRFC